MLSARGGSLLSNVTVSYYCIQTYVYTKRSTFPDYGLMLWFAGSCNFPVRALSKVCSAYSGIFILAFFVVAFVVLVAFIGSAYILV